MDFRLEAGKRLALRGTLKEIILEFARGDPILRRGFADYIRCIRGAALLGAEVAIPGTAPDAAVARIRDWAKSCPGVAQAIRAATRQQAEQAIRNAEMANKWHARAKGIEGLAASFPDATQAIAQFAYSHGYLCGRFADYIRYIRGAASLGIEAS